MKNIFKNTHEYERKKIMHKIKNRPYSTILNKLIISAGFWNVAIRKAAVERQLSNATDLIQLNTTICVDTFVTPDLDKS